MSASRAGNRGELDLVSNDKLLAVYVAHRGRLIHVANGILGDAGRAEDVVQEAFVRLRKAAGERLLDEPARYLYRIVRNLALDGQRSRARESRLIEPGGESDVEAVAEARPTPEEEVIARQELERVVAAMAELPHRTRIALEMHRVQGCTLKDIADHFGISVSMAQVLVVEGVRYCQRAL